MDGINAKSSLYDLWYIKNFWSWWPLCSSSAGLALASGLAATVTITHMLKAGDGIVCMDDVYGGEAPLCNINNYSEEMMQHHPHHFHAGLEPYVVIFGDVHVVSLSYLQGTNRYFQRIAAEVGLEVSFADCTKPEELKAALKANTKVSQRKML